jgi:hypothetical protein
MLRPDEEISEEDLQSISNAVTEADNDIEDIDTLLEHTSSIYSGVTATYDTLIREFAAKRNDIRFRRNTYAQICHRLPVFRIPDDTLREIFQWVVRDDEIQIAQCPDLTRNVYRISTVCRRWRAVALSTPRLWSTFAIQSQMKTTRDVVAVLDRVLARSRKTGISLRIVPCNLMDNLDVMDRVLDRLFARSDQWRDANILIMPQTVPQVRSAVYNLDFARLQSLEIRHGGKGTFDKDNNFGGIFRTATNLKRLTLSSLKLPPSQSLGLPFAPLQELTVTFFPADVPEAYAVLRSCISLTRLSVSLMLDRDSFNPRIPSQSSITTLKHVRSFRLQGDWDYALSFIDHLAFPNLEAFAEEIATKSQTLPSHSQIYNLSRRSEWTLRKLKIGPRTMSSGVLHLLADIPSVIDLHLWNPSPEVINALCVPPSLYVLLPHLESLCIRRTSDASDLELVRMIRSRARPNSLSTMLKNVAIGGDKLAVTAAGSMKDLKEILGLTIEEVTIRYCDRVHIF